MLYAGRDITSPSDKMLKVTLDYLYSSIKSPKPEIAARIRQLRITRDIDRKRYSQMKRSLPYVVCGSFNPPYRKKDNFAFIEYFIIDIDHISDKQLAIDELRQRIQSDPRTLMCFVSPSEDGLKVLFRLNERCYDSGIYSLFYKVFAKDFASHNGLEQVIDSQTCDVSRACFISMDEDVYYNPSAETVNMKSYLDTDSPQSMFDVLHNISNDRPSLDKPADIPPKDTDPDGTSIDRIKEILKLNKPKPSGNEVYVPQELNVIIDDLKSFVENAGVAVNSIDNISYGKKIKMSVGLKQAEINVFFGKRGFSVVTSPRTGTNTELNSLMKDLISSYFNQIS